MVHTVWGMVKHLSMDATQHGNIPTFSIMILLVNMPGHLPFMTVQLKL
jgi:hypothetical protein